VFISSAAPTYRSISSADQQPAREGTPAGIKLGGVSPQLQKQILQDLFGCLLVPKNTHERSKKHRRVPIVDRRKGSLVA
jgi:hypothetical protein